MKRKLKLRRGHAPVADLIAGVFGGDVTEGPGGLLYVKYMGHTLGFDSSGKFMASGPPPETRGRKWNKAEAEFARQEIDIAVDLYNGLRDGAVRPARAAELIQKAKRAEPLRRPVASEDVRRAAAATVPRPRNTHADVEPPGWRGSFDQDRLNEQLRQQEELRQVMRLLAARGFGNLVPVPGVYGQFESPTSRQRYLIEIREEMGRMVDAVPIPTTVRPEDY